MDLNPHVKSLARAIMETKEYKGFKALKASTIKNGNFQKRINEVKDIQFKLYQAELNGKGLDNRTKTQLHSKVEELTKDSVITDYLNSEVNFHNVLYKALNSVTESIESTLK